MMHSLCTHHGCRWPDCSLGSCPTYEVLTRREETYLHWHQPMHSNHHDSDSMRLIRLWATQEETGFSSSPPKLLLRMNHNYSWRHLLHDRWRLLLLLGSTMRPTLTPPTPAVHPTPPWRLQSKVTKSYCTQALTAPPMNLLRLGGSEVLLPLGHLTASLGPPATVAIFQEKSLGLQE